MRFLLGSIFAAGFLFAAPIQANAAYIFTDLGSLGGNSGANAINNLGQVVGTSSTADNFTRAFLWNNGTMTNLGTLDGNNSGALDLNDLGQVVGYSLTSSDVYRATLWQNGTVTNLGTLGGTYSAAEAINNAGQIVGNSHIADNSATHAVLWSGGAPTDLGTLAGGNSYAMDINSTGQIIGYSAGHATLWDSGSKTDLGASDVTTGQALGINDLGQIVGLSYTPNMHAAFWNGSIKIDLGTLGGSYSVANALNNLGQIVGYTSTAQGERAYIWSDGGPMTDLNGLLDASTISAGWVLLGANDINDSGWIVGTASNKITGQQHAFLLSVAAVPEPETYTMMLAGLGLMGIMTRRRKQTEA